MKLAFLRHGPTEWNAQGRVQGHTDIPLSEEGLQKMRGLRPVFAAKRVFSSPLLRARQTAEAFGFTDPILDARLMEQHWGRWEGMTRAEVLEREGADAFERCGRAAQFRPPGGESIQEFHDRVAAFIADAAQGEGDGLVVAHMGVLRAAYTLSTGWDMGTPMPQDLDVSKMLVVETDGRVTTLAALNVGLQTL